MRPSTIGGIGGAGLLIFVTLVVVAPASAVPFFRSAAFVQVGPAFSSELICLRSQDVFDPDFVSEAHCIGNVPGGTFDVFASGSSSIGKMGALARIDLNNFTAPGPVVAEGFGAFSDKLTFSAGSRAVFTFDVGGVGGGQIEDIHGRFEVVSSAVRVARVVTFSEVLTPGQPLAIDFGLTSKIQAADPNTHSVSDFSDTATLESVQVLDSSGNPLSGVSILSESGFDYSNLGAASGGPSSPVPEPSTWLLLCSGLGIMVFRARQQKSDRQI